MASLTPALDRAMGVVAEGPEPTWNLVVAEFLAIISAPPTGDGRQVLQRVLQFEGRLQLDETGEMPHSKSAEDMLRSLAAQARERWDGPGRR
jgi:hypothetical protein